MPRIAWSASDPSWLCRLDEMERAYDDLTADPRHLRLAYEYDLGGHREMLSTVHGSVLDVGGGNGIIRDFLPAGVTYVSIDPSLAWFDPSWQNVADAFPSITDGVCFVRGVGEHLPFASHTFDTVLSFWSLNHVADPSEVIRQARRVLRDNGRFILVVEDVEPKWMDVLRGSYVDKQAGPRRIVIRKLLAAVRGWPIQSDHIRIGERRLFQWLDGLFTVSSRTWKGSYLSLDLLAA